MQVIENLRVKEKLYVEKLKNVLKKFFLIKKGEKRLFYRIAFKVES